MGYHLEHYLLMTVPYFRLPEMHRHRLLVERDAIPEEALGRGYLAVLRKASSGKIATGRP
jgi:fatty acid desaturase